MKAKQKAEKNKTAMEMKGRPKWQTKKKEGTKERKSETGTK